MGYVTPVTKAHEDELLKWSAFIWFVRDSALARTAAIHCLIHWTTVQPLLPTNQQPTPVAITGTTRYPKDGVRVHPGSRHFLSQKLRRFHKNICSWVENECCCPLHSWHFRCQLNKQKCSNQVTTTHLFWISETLRFHPRVPNLQISCRDLTTWQGTRIASPSITTGRHDPF